jgi:hypothetical protein
MRTAGVLLAAPDFLARLVYEEAFFHLIGTLQQRFASTDIMVWSTAYGRVEPEQEGQTGQNAASPFSPSAEAVARRIVAALRGSSGPFILSKMIFWHESSYWS